MNYSSIDDLIALRVSNEKRVEFVPAKGVAERCRVDLSEGYWRHLSSGRVPIGKGRDLNDWENEEVFVIGIYDPKNPEHLKQMTLDDERIRSKLGHQREY